ncbi:S-layer homology domain-containing protein, partial [Patescibacteria group bacterium]|nr:S-layer homology domain-containing protein [Patescibacteria group bacterium]
MTFSFVYRKFRKSIAGFTLLALLSSFASFVGIASAVTTFSDVPAEHFAYDQIYELVDQGVVSGYEDGNFGPNDELTRAQLAKIAVLAFLGEDELDYEYDAGFTDVESSDWSAVYINTAHKHGIVGGYTDAEGDSTGQYGPNDTINRADAAKILVSAAGLTTDTSNGPHFPDVDEGTYYYDYVETAYNNSVVSGYADGTYGPGNPVLRGEVAKMTVNAQNPTPPVPGDDDDDDVVPVDGTLSVDTLSISGGNVPKSASAVQMLGLELTANGADMTLDSLTVKRSGVGSPSDISNLYFYQGENRVGSGHSISSDTNTATFNQLNVDVAEGDTEWVWIKADFASSATASNQHYISVESSDSMSVTGGEVSGSFPLVGPTFTIGGQTAGTVTVTKNATVANPTIGEEEAEVANFKLAAANENMSLEAIALTVKGTINASGLQNFQLVQNGVVLATADTINSDDLVTFVLDTPFVIAKGSNKTFSVYAEVTSSADANDTIIVYLGENTDLLAVGGTYGYGAAVTRTSYDYSVTDGTESNNSTVQGGQITIAFNGPSASNFAPNQKDRNFLDLTFTAGRDVEVRQLTFTVAATGSGLVDADDATLNYTDLKLVNADSGATLMGPSELSASGSDSSQNVTFTDSWYLDTGTSVNAQFQMDVANESTLDTTPSVVTVSMSAVSTTAGIKDTQTGEYITDLVPATAITGYAQTAQASALSVAMANEPASTTVVKGTQKALLAGFVFSAGDASDIKITRLDPTVDFTLAEDATYSGTWANDGSTGSTTYARELVQTLYAYAEDGTTLLGTEAVATNGKSTFDGLDITVPAGGTYTVWIRGDINTTAPADGTYDYIGVDIEATGDVVAEDD